METDSLYDGPSVLAPGARRSPDRLARFLLWPLFISLFIITLVFYGFFSALHVDGDSMEPALHHGERILRTKTYKKAHRGDIVIIDSGTDSNSDDIVKRVVAISGDTIEIRDDIALVNGLVEDFALPMRAEGYGLNLAPMIVPEGYVYVLGDNRPVSLDSRIIGPVPIDKVRGRAKFVFLPLHLARRL